MLEMDGLLRDKLLDRAREARHHAYAPYSGYTVGAAVWCEHGDIFTGANVENASYGLTVCAERVAVLCAVGKGVRRIRGMAVVTRDGATPCGACRQVLAEFADDDMVIWCATEESGEVTEYRLRDLLPNAFHLSQRQTTEDELKLGGF